MIPSSVLHGLTTYERNDAATRELRAYARWEWNADLPALFAAARRPRAPAMSRLRAWLRPRTRLRTRDAPDGGSSSPPTESILLTPVPPDDCLHSEISELGAGGRLEFLRCTRCGVVLIEGDGRLWTIRPPGSRAAGVAARGSSDDKAVAVVKV